MIKLYFTGSDVQLLNEFPKQLSILKLPYVLKYRKAIRSTLPFAEEVWVDAEHLIPELKLFGIKNKIKVHHDKITFDVKIPKVKHEGFNILYYWHNAGEWNKWIYGYDIFLKVKKIFRCVEDIHFIESQNYQQLNMAEIYPITDFYLRCNNHDGSSRMVRECQVQEIPYYWSYKNPDINVIVLQIKKEYEHTMQKMSNDCTSCNIE